MNAPLSSPNPALTTKRFGARSWRSLNGTDADGFLATPAPGIRSPLASELSQITMTGRALGTYHLQALVGVGGMGEVYRAHDATLGRDVAIKILPPAFTSRSRSTLRASSAKPACSPR